MDIDLDLTNINDTKAVLLGDFMTFTRTFYELRTGREFLLSNPPGRECRHKVICRHLRKVFTGEIKNLIINIPPRHGKTEWAIHFVAWALANYPDSNFIYASYSQSVATHQTSAIRDILSLPYYKAMFGVGISAHTKAKDNFFTTGGGEIFASGTSGSITSRGAGIKGATRFGGAIICDDLHKPLDVFSDTIRAETNNWFFNTLSSRVNQPDKTPMIFIGQMLHEDDILANLKKQRDHLGNPVWTVISLSAIDECGNVLDPAMHSLQALRTMEKEDKYVFSAQYQQNPLPAGGGIFSKEDFKIYEFEPTILTTFLTCDTAETDKDYNDATVFSFFGIYKIEHNGIDTGLYGLHWIDCKEIRVEPKDLESEFLDFYAKCMRHKVKLGTACIEKKSTGVTLASCLKGTPGLRIIDVQRTKAGGSKTARFLECQPFVARNQVSFTQGARHLDMCITHMSKITSNDSHMHDDIADTLEMGIRAALITGIVAPPKNEEVDLVIQALNTQNSYLTNLRQQI